MAVQKQIPGPLILLCLLLQMRATLEIQMNSNETV